MTQKALLADRIFDGTLWHNASALLVDGTHVRRIVPKGSLPLAAERVDLTGTVLVPGLIDLQVNGGGGVLFGAETTDLDAIRTITHAHARRGTTRVLVTLITDRPEVTMAALAAGAEAQASALPGYLGLHLEGPHLSLARKGAHDPVLIRPMSDGDLDLLLAHAHRVGVLKTTVAPENTTEAQITSLANAGIKVSLGHSDCDAETALGSFAAGASIATHLFNAMSPLSHRKPGLVGAALDYGPGYAGLIADGHHVSALALKLALRAKRGPGKLFLVSDAMSTIGTELKGFTLNGREILRRDGRLTLPDGTLAGADTDMLASLRFLVEQIDLPLEEALNMASLYPAEAAGVADEFGRLEAGYRADITALNPDLSLAGTWIDGHPIA